MRESGILSQSHKAMTQVKWEDTGLYKALVKSQDIEEELTKIRNLIRKRRLAIFSRPSDGSFVLEGRMSTGMTNLHLPEEQILGTSPMTRKTSRWHQSESSMRRTTTTNCWKLMTLRRSRTWLHTNLLRLLRNVRIACQPPANQDVSFLNARPHLPLATPESWEGYQGGLQAPGPAVPPGQESG